MRVTRSTGRLWLRIVGLVVVVLGITILAIDMVDFATLLAVKYTIIGSLYARDVI